MATRSKSTDTFKGLVSWLSMLLLMCTVTVGLGFLVVGLCVEPMQQSFAKTLRELLEYLRRIRMNAPGRESEQFRALSVAVLFSAALIFTFLFRADRKEFESRIAGLLGRIWVEVKLLLIVLMILLTGVVISADFIPGFPLMLCIPLLTVYFLCLDVGRNRRFFSHNIVHSILKKVNGYREMTTFQQRSLRRVYSCLGVIFGVILLTICVFLFLTRRNVGFWPFHWGVVCFGLMGVFGTIYWYILALKQDLRDWNSLMAQIAEMYEGNLNAVNHVPPASNLYNCAMQLNSIRTGIQKAVDEGVKADRTKVELITNVSHDIKTPLTSIISYIELLKKEPDLPPHVMDYVNTISQKADRLSHIVQDVFEVSKAATGNISLDLEDLDLGKLIKQTFAEMEETLSGAPIAWRVDIPEEPVMVHADGQRLYRVFQNLIRNCAQYSLEGSRAYVQLAVQNGMAVATLRNVSKNEVTMNGEDLTARFVRGDQNRTTEGSGLGLSIAKSFTEACGGSFSVRTDGDLFWVTVAFPVV